MFLEPISTSLFFSGDLVRALKLFKLLFIKRFVNLVSFHSLIEPRLSIILVLGLTHNVSGLL